MRRKEKISKKAKAGRWFVMFFALSALLFVYIDSLLRPLVTASAKYRLQSMITQAANDAVIDQMAKTDIAYSDLITIQDDEQGGVSLISYNSLQVNKLKAAITSSVLETIDNLGPKDIYIPIGSITNIEFLNNKGPRVHFRVSPYAYVQTDIESSFENTGINQVNHKIYIVIKINATALIPNYSTDVSLTTRVCVAQTVIIGKVPNNIYDRLL